MLAKVDLKIYREKPSEKERIQTLLGLVPKGVPFKQDIRAGRTTCYTCKNGSYEQEESCIWGRERQKGA